MLEFDKLPLILWKYINQLDTKYVNYTIRFKKIEHVKLEMKKF
jgi:hypothetical protein